VFEVNDGNHEDVWWVLLYEPTCSKVYFRATIGESRRKASAHRTGPSFLITFNRPFCLTTAKPAILQELSRELRGTIVTCAPATSKDKAIWIRKAVKSWKVQVGNWYTHLLRRMRFSGFSFSFVSYFMAAHIADVDVTAVASQYIGSSFCYFSGNYSPSPAAALNLSHCVISLLLKRHDFSRIWTEKHRNVGCIRGGSLHIDKT
jgi:hypothetical protein